MGGRIYIILKRDKKQVKTSISKILGLVLQVKSSILRTLDLVLRLSEQVKYEYNNIEIDIGNFCIVIDTYKMKYKKKKSWK